LKYILFLILFSTIALSSGINSSLLKIHATLLPKVLLMDYDFERKSSKDNICIVIAYNKKDYKNAKLLRTNIEEKYPNGLNNYSILIELVPYTKIKKQTTEANIYYLFPGSEKNIFNTISKATKSDALTFSYLKDDLQDGVMCSVSIGSKVKPILNLEAIKANNITFRPVLLKISKIYKKERS